MSLVAYEYSSDEENDGTDEDIQDESVKSEIPNGTSAGSHLGASGTISDDDEEDASLRTTSKEPELHFNLPAPTRTAKQSIPEEEDEFLKIKATPTEKPPPKRGPVRITIPSLSQFKDLDDTDAAEKEKAPKRSTGCGLLSILPKPLSETLFKTSKNPTPESRKKQTLVPDSVMNRHAKKKALSTPRKVTQAQEKDEDSDGSDAGDDFFRLNATDDLPEVSKNELNVLIAKKAAQIAATSSRFEQEAEIPGEEETPYEDPEIDNREGGVVDETALEMLCGGGRRAKRARLEKINIVDISGDQVLPNQEEWMRSALANSTEMPKGKPTAGAEAGGMSKRKHQITYLAHQAKANEQELQAMWAANRQSRRQTQSKYGF